MEKASTPRNRLTRSSAKQVNTPKNAEQEESVEKSPGEEAKNNVRKTRRRYDSKAKTNGDTANIESRINNEDTIEDNMGDECEQEDLNINSKSQDSPKSTPKKTPSPTISRRSLRTRRSSTSGPELESSGSQKMKRSSSFGKLDSVSTPTNKRGRRAKSESKDFVFTPSKDKQSGSHDSNSKYIPNASLRIIEKIDEVNEGDKSSEDERETLNQGASNIESEGEGKIIKSCEKDNIVEQSEIEAVIETSVKETHLPTLSETEVSDKVILNDSSSQKVCNGVKIIDVSQNDSGYSNKDKDKENETEEINDNIKVQDSESLQEPCLMSMEIETKSPNPTTFSERNKSPEIGSPAEETLELNESNSDIIFMELVSKTEKKTSQLGSPAKESLELNESNSETIFTELVSKTEKKTRQLDDDEISENPNCEIQESVEMNEIIHDNTVKTNNEFEVKNIEIELDDDNEPEVSFKQLDDQLQRIMDEGMEDCENDQKSSHSKSDCKRNTKTPNKSESFEISKIDLINSSDSEDGITKGQPKDAIVMKCKNDGLHTENKNIITPATYKNKCANESSKDQVETGIEENLSGLVLSPEVKDDHNNQMPDKVTEEDYKCDDKENISCTTNTTEILSDQSRIDLLEGNLSNKREEIPGLYFMDTEPSKSLNIVIENPHTIGIEDSVPENSTSDVQDKNFQDPLLEGQCPNLDEVHKNDEFQEKEINDGYGLRLNDQVTNQTDVSLDKDFKSESVENYGEESYNEEHFNENYEDEELNKSDEGSCDIYKGLSDSGSYVDEKAEGSQFGESVSSELHSGSRYSEEEYVTSVDGEEEEENVEEKTGLLNELCSGPVDVKGKELILSKNGEKANEKNPDSPMTYDKALAIINKNRVKKIDDEEFFDMFTQELNRVSEESGSDSDIAIVDEYLMEPEEPAKKNQPKSGNAQSAKQPPRPTGPVLTNLPIPPENYPGDFSQPIHAQHGTTVNQHGHPIPTQHSHATMQRVNYTQGALYQQFDQNMHLRGQLMYSQYAHPSSSMQDPHMFNPNLTHPDVNFSSGMFNHPHPVCPVPETSFPSNNTSLKVRSVTDMNNVQTPAHKNYNNPDQAPLDERTLERQDGKDSYLNMSSTSVAEVRNIDTGSIRPNKAIRHEFLDKKADKSRTPILDLLGLDKKSLKLLKKVLGLNSIKRKLMKRDLEWQKKCLEKSILKSEMRQRGRKRETRYRNVERFRESDSSSLKSSSDQSSEESSLTSSDFSKGRNYGSSSENENREVNIEEKNIYVTLKTKNQSRHQNEKEFFNLKKACHSGEGSLGTVKQKNKTKFRRKPRSSAVELESKKMEQKRPTVVKSQCGTFTVDPLTASSQSSDSEVQSFDDKHQVKELKRKMKRDLASGKNKLSNMFAQHSLKKSKESRGKVSEPFQEIKGPLRKENLKELRKLPSEILETLAKEDKKKKRHRTEESGSDDYLERPKKIRKKSQKIKVKSKAGDQNYIPCVTGGATEFGLSRLDKDGTLTLAEKATKFRMDQLYGASVKRITSKELMNIKKKQNINDSLAKKRMSRKRNAE